ncbi:hypothetical protein LUZ60_014054 [Juncus effusus]|nr:hypothetical protein LUZ60_014054 [Juncus effusus]
MRADKDLFSVDKIWSIILDEIKRVVEDSLVTTEFKSLLAVPVSFDTDQRERLMFVAELAGLDVIGIFDEPVLAARANASIDEGVIVVFQMGSTSYSVSLLHALGGDFEVKESFADSTVGGDDFDRALLNYYVEQMRKMHSVDISKDEFIMRWLKEEVVRVKTELSCSRQSSVVISTINAAATHPLDTKITLHRTNFEQLVQPLLNIIRSKCKTFIETANMSSIDQVVMSGGMSRVPIIQKLITKTFKKNPVMKTYPANSVAVGAALQGLLTINEKRKILPSMLPISIGFETVGGIFKKVIPRLSSIPTIQSVLFTTPSGEAQSFIIRIFMGEHGFCSSNVFLGELVDREKHFPPEFSPKHIRVVFKINTDRIMTVCVVDHKGLMRKSVEIPLMDALANICPIKAFKYALSNYQVYHDVFLHEVRNKGFLAMRRLEQAVRIKEKYMKRELFENEYLELNRLVGTLKSNDPKLIEARIHNAHSSAWGLEYRPIVRNREGLSDYFDTSSSDDDGSDSDYSD